MSCAYCGAETHAAQRCDTAEAMRARAAQRPAAHGALYRLFYGTDDETVRHAFATLLLRYALILLPVAVGLWAGAEWLMRHSPTR